MNNPKVPKLPKLGPAMFNTPSYWRIENGGAGGIGNARSIARIYDAFASGGAALRLGRDTLAALEATARRPARGWQDKVLRTDVRYSLGLEKPAPNNAFGTSDAAYGTFAIGGSYAFADPATHTSYCYTTNRPGYRIWGEPRELAVRQAVSACIDNQYKTR
jgi:CubicO group peptidase (beta-lactamase class C family)